MKKKLTLFCFQFFFIFIANSSIAQVNIKVKDVYWRNTQNKILRMSVAENGVKEQELTFRLILDNQNYKTFTNIFPIKLQIYRLSSAGATIVELQEIQSIEELPRDFVINNGKVTSNRVSLITKNFAGHGTYSFKILDAENREIRFVHNSAIKSDFGISIQ